MSNYFYNGVSLPPLPGWDGMPPAGVFILHDGRNGTYVLCGVSAPLQCVLVNGEDEPGLPYDVFGTAFLAVEGAEDWGAAFEFEPLDYFSTSAAEAYVRQRNIGYLWTQENIMSADGLNVYMVATPPIKAGSENGITIETVRLHYRRGYAAGLIAGKQSRGALDKRSFDVETARHENALAVPAACSIQEWDGTPGNYLYNGVELPPLPHWDGMPPLGIFILKTPGEDFYRLYGVNDVPFCVNVGGSEKIAFAADVFGSYQKAREGETSWYGYVKVGENLNDIADFVDGVFVLKSAVKFVWSEKDIYRVNGADVFFYGSTPVEIQLPEQFTQADLCRSWRRGFELGMVIGLLLKKGEKNVVMPEPEAGADGYIYDGMVLPKAEWDREARPYAFMGQVNDAVNLYSSATPFIAIGYVTISPPYSVSTYDRSTNSWGEATEVTEGSDVLIYANTYGMWSNHTIKKSDGTVVLQGTTPKAFYLNDPNTPTAFLSTTGYIEFKSNSTPISNFVAAYVGWDTTQYTSNVKVPWRRIDKESISSVAINADAIPVHTDYWFYTCSNLSRVTLPEGLKKIGKYMFYATNLYSFNNVFPNTLEEIGERAFAKLVSSALIGSSDRTSIIISDSVKKIGDYAFYDAGLDLSCGMYTGAGCEEIGGYAFAMNSTLKRIGIGASVRRIAPYAFRECGDNRAAINRYDDAYCKITFNNTNGWWTSINANATEGTAVDVSDPAENAKKLAGYSYGGIFETTWADGTHWSYYWNRNLTEEEIDDIVIDRYPDAASADKMLLVDENGNVTRGYLYNTADNPFVITDYNSETTEFKAKGWLRVAYHTTGEYAGQITIDDF